MRPSSRRRHAGGAPIPRRKGQTPTHVEEQRRVAWKQRKHRDRLAAAAPAPKTDQEMIAEALAAGRVTHLPDGPAMNPLRWPAFESVGRKKNPN